MPSSFGHSVWHITTFGQCFWLLSFLIARKCTKDLEFSVSDNRKHIHLSVVNKGPKWGGKKVLTDRKVC